MVFSFAHVHALCLGIAVYVWVYLSPPWPYDRTTAYACTRNETFNYHRCAERLDCLQTFGHVVSTGPVNIVWHLPRTSGQLLGICIHWFCIKSFYSLSSLQKWWKNYFPHFFVLALFILLHMCLIWSSVQQPVFRAIFLSKSLPRCCTPIHPTHTFPNCPWTSPQDWAFLNVLY